MKLLKVILIISYVSFSFLLLVVLTGLIHRLANPGYKSLSNLDLKQLFGLIIINLIITGIVLMIKRLIRGNGVDK